MNYNQPVPGDRQTRDTKVQRVVPEFQQILGEYSYLARFQPVLSFHSARIFGYRVEHELQKLGVASTIADLFQHALSLGRLPLLEELMLEQILRDRQAWVAASNLFLPLSWSTFSAQEFTLSSLDNLLQWNGLTAKQVILDLTDVIPALRSVELMQKFHVFRQRGYRFAFAGMRGDDSWLKSVLLYRPEYVNIEPSLVRNIEANIIHSKILEIVLELAEKQHCGVIVQGIASLQELQVVLRMGAHFGAGSVFEERDFKDADRGLAGADIIQAWIGRQQGSSQPGRNLKGILRPIKTVEKLTPVAQVVQYFNEFELETGIVVVEGQQPLGLVMRDRLFQRLAFKYGYALYWNREIANLMDEDLLILEVDTSLETASRMSMARHRDKIYDLVIVTEGGKFGGAITIRDLLNAMTQIQMELARDANPLTGLPGNRRIEREIEQRIESEHGFSIIYIDLDHFKWFNDLYGFQKGDMVISYTADLLRQSADRLGEPGDFVGHIGGDDFILITTTADVLRLCQAIISRFDKEISRFYAHPIADPFLATDRFGSSMAPDGISISLSVLECPSSVRARVSPTQIAEQAGHLKKIAKRTKGSTTVRGRVGNPDHLQ